MIQKIRYFIAVAGFAVCRATGKKDIVQLLASLHPYNTQFDLIRFGSNSDGGYLIPNDLEGIGACFSPGVGGVSKFEQDCLCRGMQVFMSDKSVEKAHLDIPDNGCTFDFQRKFIGCTNDGGFTTMDDWVRLSNLPDTMDLMLQMDIEGGEYYSLINISGTLLKRFRIIVVEFHDLHRLWHPLFFDLAKTVFEKILQTHVCVHIHPNNFTAIKSRRGVGIPDVGEFTFIRKDRVTTKGFQTTFPHALDRDNANHKASVVLPRDWYRSEP